MMGNMQTDVSLSFPADRIVPLNFDNFINNKELPETDVWSSGNDLSDHQQVSETLVPIINVSDSNAGQMMRKAFENLGVFQAIGHGVPLSLMKEVEAETRRLFALSMETKLHAVTKPGEYAGYGLPRMSKFYPNEVWSEGFTVRGSPNEHATRLWADLAQCNRFCNVMNEYQKELDMLAKKIISLVLTSLGLNEDDAAWMNPVDRMTSQVDLPPTALRLNSYPVCPNPSKAIGMNPHTDTSIITLLYQGNVGGLQIQLDNGEWVNVQPVEGALVVNLGDLMHIFTNGKLKSVMHRVMVNGSRHRISVGYFYGPPRDVEVAPSEKLMEEGKGPVLYPTVTWDEYMKLKHTHGQKALDMIKIENNNEC